MTFDEVWDGVAIGAIVSVSNGRSAPPGGLGAPRYNLWRSHNFSGALLEKREGPPRILVIADAANPKAVAYEVAADVAHTFALVE